MKIENYINLVRSLLLKKEFLMHMILLGIFGSIIFINLIFLESVFYFNPKTKIFCHIGGMRSKIALEWINQTNTITSVISGGYKRFRRLCLSIVKLHNISYKNWIILGGYTGSGKTEFIKL